VVGGHPFIVEAAVSLGGRSVETVLSLLMNTTLFDAEYMTTG
jgi:DNA topoisomerase VI subunit B